MTPHKKPPIFYRLEDFEIVERLLIEVASPDGTFETGELSSEELKLLGKTRKIISIIHKAMATKERERKGKENESL